MLENAFHQPYWHTQTQSPNYPSLNENIQCDAAIVGGGISGLTSALNLCKSNLNVVLIEMNTIAQSATALSTGHLDNYYDQQYNKLIKNYGLDTAKTIIHAKKNAIDTIENLVNEYNLQCDLRRIPAYLYCEEENDYNLIEKENDSASSLNINCSITENIPLNFNAKKSLIFPNQARFSPLAYIAGLADAVTKMGGRIFEQTTMKSYKHQKDTVLIHTTDGTIEAQNLILCGHTSLTGKLSIQTRIYPMLSFVIAAEVEDQVEDALYWDTAVPYHYTRIAASENPFLLIIGGADCHTGTQQDTKQYYTSLLNYADKHYKIKSIPYYWCNEYFEPVDGLPYAGFVPLSSNVLVAGAYSGDGLTFGTMCAGLIRDLILKKQNPLEQILSPSRFKPIASLPKITKIIGHATKHLFVDRISGLDDDFERLHNDQGKIMKIKDHVSAVYKDKQGELHVFSAACRHMGCIVQWNSAEQTWDCPCHGGRYDCLGHVISGPPRDSLKKIEVFASI